MLRLLTLMVIFSFIVSCTQPDNKDKDTEKPTETKGISGSGLDLDKTVVAKVNNKPVYKYLLDENLDDPLKEAIIREMFIQKAINDGLVEKRDFSNIDLSDWKQTREMNQYNFKAFTLTKNMALKNVNVNQKITDEDVNNYYNNNIVKYTYIKTLKFTVDGDEKTAQNVMQMLSEGSTVNDIRAGNSDLKISVEEKKLTNNPLILDSFDVLEVGEVGSPIRFAGNFDIYKITEVKKVPVEKITASIKQNIKSNKKKAAIHAYADNLVKSKEFNVEILENGEKG